MDIILGGTGHVGAAAARALLARGAPVTVVTSRPDGGADLAAAGARIAVADVNDRDALRGVFRTGRRAFLLNPPADPAGDAEAAERASAAAIVAALDGSGLERVVAESTYGAQPGDQIGDLGVLHDFERGLAAQRIPAVIVRGAYYMSNWDASLRSAREEGVIRTPLPADLRLPMVDPADIGRVAASLLVADGLPAEPVPVEGPERCTPAEVATAFADALGCRVEVESVPRKQWPAMYRDLGFADATARSYAGMTARIIDGGLDLPAAPRRGVTRLDEYVAALIRRDAS